ncbi:hypothetical protein EV652_10842 [Kribbella steppae]|uniref:RiboL-PSP-HEPN domain-containing protein n=1 Tax=Kribbella steppae TaxID=2512223 RepID=A0A4R2HB00_9ACTN|nr:HEPN domain-containing protein [Kribbella steppae]TCO24511.1 hypothetical protein EV652_10842 [Kribbella steppae]
MAQLEQVLHQFHEDLERAGHLLRLIKEFRRFAGSKPPVEVTDGTVAWLEASDLADVAPAVRTDLPILAGSILLYVCGRFEYFAREIVVALADEAAAQVSEYADLPDKLRAELKHKTLEVAQSPSRFGFTSPDAEQMLIALGQNLGGAGSVGAVTISSRVLSITESNMNSNTLVEVLKRVGVIDVWTDLGKQAPLKSYLSIGNDKESMLEAKVRLDSMMKDRNGVAHPTGANTFPDPDQVLESVAFLRVLSQVIIDVVRVPRQ